jgi:hypothetical protein
MEIGRHDMVFRDMKKDLKFIRGHTLQPRWWKFGKIFLLLGTLAVLFLTCGLLKTAIWFAVVVVLSLAVHMLYRVKTRTFTRSWMDFNVNRLKGKWIYGRIGRLYYSLVALILITTTSIMLLLP